MKSFLMFALILISAQVIGQTTQIVRGKVVDSETQFPVFGAQVRLFLSDTDSVLAVLSDPDGEFEFAKVPVGKHELSVNSSTHETVKQSVIVNSGKQTVLEIKVLEKVSSIEEVQVVARKNGEVGNEMATVSAQQFSVEETERFAGSRGDPARMASNFAGVQGADDSRNDIIVRGNSPLGIVYKIEGIDIPNPSHFSISGSSGGPVSIINNKSLANSDFFMSAFPAEYGNSISGIFDLKLRNGNNKQHEFTGQLGLLGTELMAEGPLTNKGRASYLVMGRYSTLSIFQKFGIKIGTDAVPIYGDGAFKFNFPLKNGGQLAFWGIGGKSQISIVVSDKTTYTEDLYGEGDRDQYFGTSMFVSGLTYRKPLSEKTFFTASVSGSIETQHANHNYLIRSLDTTVVDGQQQINVRVDSMYALMGYNFQTIRTSGYFSFNHKINKKQIIKFGLNADVLTFNMIDSVKNEAQTAFINRWDYQGSGLIIQPFIQWKYRMSDAMEFTAGLHAQYFSLSQSLSPAEPRIGWKYQFTKDQKVFAGAGLHSQTQPYYIYSYHQFDNTGNKVYQNKKMDFTKAIHAAIGYERSFKKGFNLRTEVYYQNLYHVPVEVNSSSFSMINQGSGFSRFFPDSLKNTGTGVNYGFELTIQKFFDKSFYILFTTSIYDSKYKGSDGVLRNTSYNGLYTSNILFGKEFKLKKGNSIGVGGKVTVAGGKRYGYVDIAKTNAQRELVFQDSLFNERQFKDYFRADIKINWKKNAKKVTHEVGLDLVNILNTKNILGLSYAPNLANPNAEPLAQKTQLGFLPIFYYRIEFKVGTPKS